MRRSWETAPIMAPRQRSISSRRRVRTACSCSWARSTARAAWLANVPSRARSRRANCTSWRTSRPTGRLLATSATATRPGDPPGHAQRSGLPVAGGERDHLLGRELLSRPGGHGELRAFGSRRPVVPGQEERRPARREDGLHRAGDVLEQFRKGEITDQGLGELEKPVGVPLPALGVLPCGLLGGHDAGHDQHDDRRRRQGRPSSACRGPSTCRTAE